MKWPYVRFTGVVFVRCSVDEQPDGVPMALSRWSRRADMVVVSLPTSMVSKAGAMVGQDREGEWCGIFELYGEDAEMARIYQNISNHADRDIDLQMKSWSDHRLTLRTETDLNNPNGPQPFHEDFLSYIE